MTEYLLLVICLFIVIIEYLLLVIPNEVRDLQFAGR